MLYQSYKKYALLFIHELKGSDNFQKGVLMRDQPSKTLFRIWTQVNFIKENTYVKVYLFIYIF